MASLGKVIRENHGVSAVAYFFESGDQYQAQSQQFISVATENPELKAMYCHRSHTVADKSDVRLLETADILAWEWAKHRERSRSKQDMRPSLRAMLDADGAGVIGPLDFASATRRAIHVTGEPLERYFDKVIRLILS
jgi:hypothetical protein